MNNSNWQWDPSLNEILQPIRSLPGSTVIIGISGYGGSGKTTLAQAMADQLAAVVVSIDEFGTSSVFKRSSDWHGFDRKRLMRQVLEPLATRGARELSYDSCDDWDSWETVSTHLVVERFLIVEGVGLFHPELVPYLAYRIWLDVPLADASARGIAREESLGRVPGDVWQYVWEPNEIDFERKFQPKESVHCMVCPRISLPCSTRTTVPFPATRVRTP